MADSSTSDAGCRDGAVMGEWRPRFPGSVAACGHTMPGMRDVDREALQWLTVEELAARRRQLVREYDRALRQSVHDRDRIAEIWAEAEAIAQVQRGRRR